MSTITKKEIKLYGNVFRVLTTVVLLLFATSSYVSVFAASASVIQVTVVDGENRREVSSLAKDPVEIITGSGIRLRPNDRVNTTGFDPEEGGVLVINRARTLRVVDNDAIVYCVGYDDSTIGDTLEERDIELDKGDKTDVDLDAPVDEGMEVVITRADNVSVEVDGEKHDLSTADDDTIDSILELAGLSFDKDTEEPREEATEAKIVDVDTVEYKVRTEIEKIPCDIQYIDNNSMFTGETKVIEAGKNGVKEVTYSDKYVNGKLVKTTKTATKVTVEPADRVLEVGTVPVPSLKNYRDGTEISKLSTPSALKLDENGLPVNYEGYIIGESTAYTGDPETSTGRTPMQGHVAVDPTEIPYGSELYIVSLDGKYVYGYAVAADTGGFIYTSDTVVDLYLDTEEMCDDWGRRDVAIYILSYGNEKR